MKAVKKRFVSSLVVGLALGGCAVRHAPCVAYPDLRPLSDTALFASIEGDRKLGVETRITSVDGAATPCLEAGCPYWARVVPGVHTFPVRYGKIDGQFTHVADVDVSTERMQPGHVYVARYSVSNKKVSATIGDLGERPDFGLRFGNARYTAEF